MWCALIMSEYFMNTRFLQVCYYSQNSLMSYHSQMFWGIYIFDDEGRNNLLFFPDMFAGEQPVSLITVSPFLLSVLWGVVEACNLNFPLYILLGWPKNMIRCFSTIWWHRWTPLSPSSGSSAFLGEGLTKSEPWWNFGCWDEKLKGLRRKSWGARTI